MSLPLLVVIVVFGIALSVLAVHFTGGSKTATLASADQALERFAEDFPDDLATAVRLTADGRTAFLDLAARAHRDRSRHRRLLPDAHRDAWRRRGLDGRRRCHDFAQA